MAFIKDMSHVKYMILHFLTYFEKQMDIQFCQISFRIVDHPAIDNRSVYWGYGPLCRNGASSDDHMSSQVSRGFSTSIKCVSRNVVQVITDPVPDESETTSHEVCSLQR